MYWCFNAVLQFRGASQVVCNMCPKRDNALCTMHPKHAWKHVGTGIHQRHARIWASTHLKTPSKWQHHHHEAEPPPPPSPSPVDDGDNMFASSAMDVDNTIYTQEPHPIWSDHEVVPVADLWNTISSSPFYQANETYDLYEELQSALASGEQLFSMPLAPVSEEIGFDDKTESNFGIELPGETLFDSLAETYSHC